MFEAMDANKDGKLDKTEIIDFFYAQMMQMKQMMAGMMQ
jgi:hypothetical protein